ncbi:2OG-Fe(II) oxygenase [Oscillatoriales cyanobacterium USR001]|nr:2OG-Fe(II) oxygenase [Oscillatoriales cyanobacterium USR001]
MELIKEELNLPDASVFLYHQFFDLLESNQLFTDLSEQIEWQQNPIIMFGKLVLQPRLTAYYGEKPYTYSGVTMQPKSWQNALLQIKDKIELLTEVKFNAVLLNLYRDGSDYLGWHSDDEKELAEGSVIGSLSLGESRRFLFRRRDNHQFKVELNLKHGDFLIMSGKTQKYWQHQVPKTKAQLNPRINLTFRVIK